MTVKPPVDRRIRRTRKAIRGAMQDLLHTHGLEQITIREIAERADVSYTTFFRHYPDKEAVLAELADDEIARLLHEALPLVNIGNAKTNYTACVAACRHIDKDRALWTALLTGGAAGMIRSSFIERTRESASDMQSVHSWLPRDVGTIVAVGITLDVLTWWLGRAREAPPEQIAEMLDKLLVAIVPRDQRQARIVGKTNATAPKRIRRARETIKPRKPTRSARNARTAKD